MSAIADAFFVGDPLPPPLFLTPLPLLRFRGEGDRVGDDDGEAIAEVDDGLARSVERLFCARKWAEIAGWRAASPPPPPDDISPPTFNYQLTNGNHHVGRNTTTNARFGRRRRTLQDSNFKL